MKVLQLLKENGTEYHKCDQTIVGDGTVDFVIKSFFTVEDLLLDRNYIIAGLVECAGEWLPQYAFNEIQVEIIKCNLDWADAVIIETYVEQLPEDFALPLQTTQSFIEEDII